MKQDLIDKAEAVLSNGLERIGGFEAISPPLSAVRNHQLSLHIVASGAF